MFNQTISKNYLVLGSRAVIAVEDFSHAVQHDKDLYIFMKGFEQPVSVRMTLADFLKLFKDSI